MKEMKEMGCLFNRSTLLCGSAMVYIEHSAGLQGVKMGV